MTNALLPRFFLVLSVAAGLAFGAFGFSANPAAAQTRSEIGAIEVDVSALRAKGLGGFADMVGEAVRAELRARYATTRGGARLVVSLESLFLTGSPDIDRDRFDTFGGFGGFGSFAAQDSLSGVNYLIARDGRVIETYPLIVSSPAAAAGPPMLPLERERAIILAQTYASWLARRF